MRNALFQLGVRYKSFPPEDSFLSLNIAGKSGFINETGEEDFRKPLKTQLLGKSVLVLRCSGDFPGKSPEHQTNLEAFW